MHLLGYVLLSKPFPCSLSKIEHEVIELMAPYCDDWYLEEREYQGGCVVEGSPDPNCEFCDGSGVEKEMVNPDGKWDHYKIGDKWVNLLEFSREKGTSEYGEAIAPVRDLDLNLIGPPDFIITPDGGWHDQYLDWADSDSDWHKMALELLVENRDALLVVLDCHC